MSQTEAPFAAVSTILLPGETNDERKRNPVMIAALQISMF